MNKHIDEIAASELPYSTEAVCNVHLQDDGPIYVDKLRSLLFQIERTFGHNSNESRLRIFDDTDSGMKVIAIDYDLFNLANDLDAASDAAHMADQKIRQVAVEAHRAGIIPNLYSGFAHGGYSNIVGKAEELRAKVHHMANV